MARGPQQETTQEVAGGPQQETTQEVAGGPQQEKTQEAAQRPQRGPRSRTAAAKSQTEAAGRMQRVEDVGQPWDEVAVQVVLER